MPSQRYFNKLSERGRKMARARWDKENRRIAEEMPARLAEMELARALNEYATEPGDWIGTLEYRSRSGKVRKWVVRRGPRRDQIAIDGIKKPKSWTWLLDKLRRRIRFA